MLLFSLEVVVSVDRVRFIVERMKGQLVSDFNTVHTLDFYFFLLTVRLIRMFFSLKPSTSQGESSLKISAHQV